MERGGEGGVDKKEHDRHDEEKQKSTSIDKRWTRRTEKEALGEGTVEGNDEGDENQGGGEDCKLVTLKGKSGRQLQDLGS